VCSSDLDNYWGSTDPIQIENSIYHFDDASHLGRIIFTPFLSNNVSDCTDLNGNSVPDIFENSTSNNNNTGGGNNSGCGNASSGNQNVDGGIDIQGIASQYYPGDMILGDIEVCWTPDTTSMSTIAWLNNSNGQVYDLQVHSGSNYWPAWVGATQVSSGHWIFPINDAGSSMGTWDYSADSLPADQYCWEGLFKVYDGTSFVPVDTDSTCFTVINNATTGGGGNNSGGGSGNAGGLPGFTSAMILFTLFSAAIISRRKTE
jgi:hypothetical protein